MSDQALIRRERLKSLKISSSELALRIPPKDGDKPRSPSYFSDLMNNPKKSFGEKTARAIEEGLSLPRGWLDGAEETAPRSVTTPVNQPVIADAGTELGIALAIIRKHLVGAHGERSIAIGEALRQLAVTPDSERAFAAVAELMPELPLAALEPSQDEAPMATEEDWRELRKRAMRLAEKSDSPLKRKHAAQLLRLLDDTIRDGAGTESAPETRHGNNLPARTPR